MASMPPITPAQDFELQVTQYVYVATVAAFFYDNILAIDEEVALLSTRVNLSTAVYWVSKLSSSSMIISNMVLLVYPVGTSGQCQALSRACSWSSVIAAPSIALLFLFRVTAVFRSNRVAIGFFTFLWAAVLAAALTVPFSVTVAEIGDTERCTTLGIASFSASSVIVNWINDSLVFLAISWRLMRATFIVEQSHWARLKSFISGNGISRLSKSVLQGGQTYYLVTVGFSIATLIGILAPIPAVYHALFTGPNIVLQNAMACRVYRHLRLGLIQDMNGQFTNLIGTRTPERTMIFARIGAGQRHEQCSYPLRTFHRAHSPSVQVCISQEQEVVRSMI